MLKTVLYGIGPQMSTGGWSFGQIDGVGHSQGYGTPIHTSDCGFLSLQAHRIQNHSYDVRHLSGCGIELNMYFSHTVLSQNGGRRAVSVREAVSAKKFLSTGSQRS